MNKDFLDEDTIVIDQDDGFTQVDSGQQNFAQQETMRQDSSRQGANRQETSYQGAPQSNARQQNRSAQQSTGRRESMQSGFAQPNSTDYREGVGQARSFRVMLDGNNVLKNQASNMLDLQGFSHGKNKLLNACAEMLSLCVVVSRLPKPDDLHQHQQVLKESISNLKHRIASLDYPPSVADKTCFLFCVVLDEFIMHCEWGENSGWENHTLLSELFGMRNGGEQFFQVTEKALRQPNQLIDWLELVYIFLKMDFRGQYRMQGRERLDALMHQLELLLNPHRKSVSMTPMPPVELPSIRKPHRRIRFSGQFIALLVLIVLMWGGASFWYLSSLEQRARGFVNLPEFTWRYFNLGGDEDLVYDSTEEEMERAERLYGDESDVE